MAPTAHADISGDRATRNGHRKSGRKESSRPDPPKQTPPEPPTPDVGEGLEEFDRFFLKLHEQRDEFESNIFSGLSAQKSLEQRYAELQHDHQSREASLAAACSEVESLKGALAKRDLEAAARDAELGKSQELVKQYETERMDFDSKVSGLEAQLKGKDELVNQANEKARKVGEDKDEALRAAEKRVQRILAYAQTKVSEVVDKNQELLKRLHGAL